MDSAVAVKIRERQKRQTQSNRDFFIGVYLLIMVDVMT